MVTVRTNKIADELRRIADENNGILMPESVIEAARPKSSPLHGAFEWDDTEAAHRWRMHQARNLIRVTVEMIERDGSEPLRVRTFCSLTPDRVHGGYRATVAVMRKADTRNQLLADALAELESIERKYSALQELTEVFTAIRAVRMVA